jgi:hypothetical protein
MKLVELLIIHRMARRFRGCPIVAMPRSFRSSAVGFGRTLFIDVAFAEAGFILSKAKASFRTKVAGYSRSVGRWLQSCNDCGQLNTRNVV